MVVRGYNDTTVLKLICCYNRPGKKGNTGCPGAPSTMPKSVGNFSLLLCPLRSNPRVAFVSLELVVHVLKKAFREDGDLR